MPKYKITDPKTGKSIVIGGDSPPNEAELEEILKHRAEEYGEIRKPRPWHEKIVPSVYQTVGGVGGGMVGATVGKPRLGSAVGGTLMRGLGVLERERGKRLEEAPTFGEKLKEASPWGIVRSWTTLSPEQKQEFKEHMVTTAGIEGAGMGLGKLLSMFKTPVKGAAKELLGKRVVERGSEVGWKRLLNPEFYKGRIPKRIAIGTKSFFGKLKSVTGKKTSNLFQTKYKNTNIDLNSIKNGVRGLLPKSGDPTDLLEATAPKAQRNLITDFTNKILKMRGNFRRANTIWELRKELDDLIYNKRWTQEAGVYLKQIRKTLNEPLKNLGGDVAEAFGKYNYVTNAEDELQKKFMALKDPASGEVYAPKLESFVKNLLSTDKDETIRLLKDLDGLLLEDDKVIEQMLDYAASESLEKGKGLGVAQQMMVGAFGGRKKIAEIGAMTQDPRMGLFKTLLGRGAVVGSTELSAEEE